MVVIALGLAAIIVLLGSASVARQAESLVEDYYIHGQPLLRERWVEPTAAAVDRRSAAIRALGDTRPRPQRSHREYATYGA